jgi:hypothetical protein
MYPRWIRIILLHRYPIRTRGCWERSSLNWPDRRYAEGHLPGCRFGLQIFSHSCMRCCSVIQTIFGPRRRSYQHFQSSSNFGGRLPNGKMPSR